MAVVWPSNRLTYGYYRGVHKRFTWDSILSRAHHFTCVSLCKLPPGCPASPAAIRSIAPAPRPGCALQSPRRTLTARRH